MTLDADIIVDRRRLRRRLSTWRIVAVVALVVAVIAAIGAFGGGDSLLQSRRSHVARVTITGLITADQPTLKLIERIEKAPGVKGVIIAIDSPGGTTAGGEALYDAIRRLAAKKPVVAEMRTIATSAGYMVALASDHIVARRNTLTGSIGVIFQFGEFSRLLDKVGVTFDEVKSAPLKAEPSPYHPVSPEARQAMAELVDQSFEWFVDLVAERRKLDAAEARRLADGRVYLGGRALDLKLIDALGGERAAITWLETEHKVAKDLPVRDWKPRSTTTDLGLTGALARWLFQFLGLNPALFDGKALESVIPERLKLDGLLSVWQGPSLPTGRKSTGNY